MAETKEKLHYRIQFDLAKMSKEQQDHLWKAQEHLHKAGISFDTGQGFGKRDWEFDWSLKGPISIESRVPIKEDDPTLKPF